jgi:hypothetical protein
MPQGRQPAGRAMTIWTLRREQTALLMLKRP